MMFSDRKQQLLLQRLAGAGLLQSEQSVANDRPRREERDGPAVLSNAQRRMWYHSQLAEGSAAYNFCLVLRPDENSSLSVPALTAALEQVVLRHEILRTRYRAGADGAPQQVIEPYLAPDVTEIDVTPASNEFAETIEERLDDLACRARDQPFDLKVDAPLRTLVVRSGAAVIAIILVLPHIAGDGGSFGIVLADLERAYGHGAGSDASPPASSIRYSDYALWEQRHLGDPKTPASLHARQLRFWETQLADLPAEIPLPFDRPRPTTPSFSGSQVREWLGEGLSAALRRIAGTYGGTPLVALQCAVAVALGRVGAGQDIPSAPQSTYAMIPRSTSSWASSAIRWSCVSIEGGIPNSRSCSNASMTPASRPSTTAMHPLKASSSTSIRRAPSREIRSSASW